MTQVQDLALGLVELHEVCMGPPLKPVQVPLDGTPSLQCVSRTTQFGVISKLAEGALYLTLHVSDKGVKQHWSQYKLLRNAICHWFPHGYLAADHKSLSAAIQPIPYPLSGPSIKSISLHFRDQDAMKDSIKCFTQNQGFIPWYSAKQIPEEAKGCFPEFQVSELAVRPPHCPKDLELYHFMVITAKAALELHLPHQPLLTEICGIGNYSEVGGIKEVYLNLKMVSTIICCSQHLVVTPEPCIGVCMERCRKVDVVLSTPFLEKTGLVEATGDSSRELMPAAALLKQAGYRDEPKAGQESKESACANREFSKTQISYRQTIMVSSTTDTLVVSLPYKGNIASETIMPVRKNCHVGLEPDFYGTNEMN
ncbi:hypothetical protein llap_5947 [Limosa lapponica baueri]|uniref:Uncharacterized protein n=1 Tax=Limosa lapponica baueri TaxID=1758121 RepID=A0A2I0UCG5_LIMLA|nr:hypothetical protein llap_5947 [Limosa lapponica baueri]